MDADLATSLVVNAAFLIASMLLVAVGFLLVPVAPDASRVTELGAILGFVGCYTTMSGIRWLRQR